MNRKKTYHHGNLKEDLLEQALKVLGAEGISALSLRRVAREAGVSQTAPYSHFKDKTELLAAVATVGFKQLILRMEEVRKKELTPFERLSQTGLAYVDYGIHNTALFQLMFGSELGDFSSFSELSAASQDSYQLLQKAVAELRNEKLNQNKGQSAATVAAWSLVHGLTNLIIDNRVPTSEKGNKEVLDKLLNGLT